VALLLHYNYKDMTQAEADLPTSVRRRELQETVQVEIFWPLRARWALVISSPLVENAPWCTGSAHLLGATIGHASLAGLSAVLLRADVRTAGLRTGLGLVSSAVRLRLALRCGCASGPCILWLAVEPGLAPMSETEPAWVPVFQDFASRSALGGVGACTTEGGEVWGPEQEDSLLPGESAPRLPVGVSGGVEPRGACTGCIGPVSCVGTVALGVGQLTSSSDESSSATAAAAIGSGISTGSKNLFDANCVKMPGWSPFGERPCGGIGVCTPGNTVPPIEVTLTDTPCA